MFHDGHYRRAAPNYEAFRTCSRSSRSHEMRLSGRARRIAREYSLAVFAICLGGTAFYSSKAHSAEWAIEPSVSLRTQYNDNIRLTAAPHDSVVMTALAPQITLRKRTEISDISVRGRFEVNRYWNDSSLNTSDGYYYLNSTWLGERSRLGFDGSFVRDSTLGSELTETGVVTGRTQRSSLRLNPQWSWSISPLSAVGVSYSLSDVRYDDNQGAGVSDYRNQDISVWVSRKLTEQDELQFGTSYSKYKTKPFSYESDTLGLTASYSHAFSERLKFDGLVGVRRTESSRMALTQVLVPWIFPGLFQVVLVPQRIDSKDNGVLFRAGIDGQWTARTALRGRLSRELNPSGVGSTVENDRLSAGVRHGFNENTSIDVNASVLRTNFSDDALKASNSRYYALEARLDSRLDEHWSISAGYAYGRREFVNSAGSADSNSIFVAARYDWTKIAVSR